jgi:hypothetical protein
MRAPEASTNRNFGFVAICALLASFATTAAHADNVIVSGHVNNVESMTEPQQDAFIQPLYRCHPEAEKSHFATNREDCDRAGKMEALLGYDLRE